MSIFEVDRESLMIVVGVGCYDHFYCTQNNSYHLIMLSTLIRKSKYLASVHVNVTFNPQVIMIIDSFAHNHCSFLL